MDDTQPQGSAFQEPQEQLTKKERRELRRQEKTEAASHSSRRRRVRSLGIWAVVALVVGGSIWTLIRFSGSGSGGQTANLLSAVSADDWVQGQADAKMVLVEYGDYQCPACAAYHPIVEQLLEEFGDQIAFVYRHFPLRSIHRNADLAAQAAEAAGKQGKFWEMHARLYENQRDWADKVAPRDIFEGYGDSLDLDREQFLRDLDSNGIKERVARDLAQANQMGLRGTPTFFWNGRQIANPSNYDAFRDLISRDLNP